MNEEGGAGRQGVHKAGGTGRQYQGQDRADPNSEGEGARRRGESDAKGAKHRSTHEDKGGRRRVASDTSSSQDNSKGENEAWGAGRQGVYEAGGVGAGIRASARNFFFRIRRKFSKTQCKITQNSEKFGKKLECCGSSDWQDHSSSPAARLEDSHIAL